LERIVTSHSRVLREVGGNRSGEIAAHRLLSSDKVGVEEILEPHELLAKLSRYDRLAACQARAVRASAAVCEFDLVVPVIFRRI
jgi:hypothetical protein